MVASGVSEYSAKRLLTSHIGSEICEPCQASSLVLNSETDTWDLKQSIDNNNYNKLVLKPDQLVKRRGKLGLVHFIEGGRIEDAVEKAKHLSSSKISIGNVTDQIKRWIIEPFIDHSVEFYICIHSTTEGDTILFHHQGGVDIGDVDSKAKKIVVPVELCEKMKVTHSQIKGMLENVEEKYKKLVSDFIVSLYESFVELHLEYLEINPFTIVNDKINILDAAVKADTCAEYLCHDLWKIDSDARLEFVPSFGKVLCPEEHYIEELDSRTGSSLKFSLINPEGRIWTLIAGGGASVVYADTICDLNFSHELANYGEYSGAPKNIEVYQYSRTILSLMLKGKVTDKGKILLIGGAIANFTNVSETFQGIISALRDFKEKLQEHKVEIYVRRGGPNYQKGLLMMKDLSLELGIKIEVFGPELNMTTIIPMALGLNYENILKTASLCNKSSNNLLDKSIESSVLQNKSMHINNNNGTNGDLILEAKKNKTTSVKNAQSFQRFSSETSALVIGTDLRAIQTMLDFDFECERTPSVLAIVDPYQSEHLEPFFWGKEIIRIPVYKVVRKALELHPKTDTVYNCSSYRNCYFYTKHLLENSTNFKTMVLVAEGVPDRLTRHLRLLSKSKNVQVIGPATVGAIKPGSFKAGNTGGTPELFTSLRLYRPGSVGIVTKSGGLSSELNNIVSSCTDGVYQCVAIGGDRYPCTSFLDVVLEYNNDPQIGMIVLIGELGGVYEYEVADSLSKGEIKKPLIAWNIGTCSKTFGSDVQFGHAGAYADSEKETAQAKNQAFRNAGAYVPDSFEDLPKIINSVYEKLVEEGKIIPKPDFEPRQVPVDFQWAKSLGLVRHKPHFLTSICDERGSEVTYSNVPLPNILSAQNSIGYTIGLLWFKKELPVWSRNFLELIIPILADHGPCTSGAHNTIVAARAGKDLVSAVASGLLTIGPRFGGALDEAAKDFNDAMKRNMTPRDFVAEKKDKNSRVLGIGHAVKSVYNPDSRVTKIVEYCFKKFKSCPTLEFAQEVANILLQKKQNLILNVDGAVAAATLDMMRGTGLFSDFEIQKLVSDGLLNGVFVLTRTIGLVGHYLDQKRLNQGLYRHPWDDIVKLDN